MAAPLPQTRRHTETLWGHSDSRRALTTGNPELIKDHAPLLHASEARLRALAVEPGIAGQLTQAGFALPSRPSAL